MGTTITFRRGENDPTSGSGLTLAEPAFNTTLKTFHIGLGHGITAAWVGAPISGLSADIAAGITYKISTAAAVKNYIGGLCYGNTGAPTITQYVSSFNGLTGAVGGVCAAQANTFTALQSFANGISASGITVNGNMSVTGNFTVSGGVTFTTSETVLIEDNIITLNSNVTGSPSENAGVEIERGTSANVQLLWNESSDKWTFTNDGSTYYDLPTSVVTSFNGLTGAVTGVTVGGANTFTALNSFNAGISSAGGTFTQRTLFSGGLQASGITATTVTSEGTSTISGYPGYASWTSVSADTVKFVFDGVGGQILRPTDDNIDGTVRTNYLPASSGTLALTSQLMGAVNGSTAATTAVTSFNGLTGAVGGVCAAQSNTFTAVQTFNSGVTLASTLDVTGVARLSGGVTASRIDVTGNFKVVGDAQIGDQNTDTLTVFAGTTFNNRVDFGGTNVFRYGLTSGGAIRFSGNNAKSITTTEASLTITGATSSVIASPYNSMVFGVQTSDPLTMYSATGVVDIATNNPLTPVQPALRFNTDDQDFIGPGSIKVEPSGYATGNRTQYLQDANGTLALTSQLMGAVNGSTAATSAVTSFNGLTGAVGISAGTNITITQSGNTLTIASSGGASITNYVESFNGLTGAVTGVTVGGVNTFTQVNTFSAGISAAGSTFASTTNTLDVIASTEGAGLRIARATSGVGSRIGGIRLGRSATSSLNTYIEGSSGTFSLYNGVDNTGTLFAAFSPTQFSLGTTSASFITLNSPNIISFGDQSAVGNNQAFSMSGTARTYTFGDSNGVTAGFVGINRSGLCADYALEVNSPTGKGLQLIYNDHTGAASNWVNMDVSSGGNFTVRPSGGLATVTGTLNVSAGVCAAGITLPADGKIEADGALYIGNNPVSTTRVVIGDYDASGNSTYILVRDPVSALDIVNPSGSVRIGDPDGIVSGNYFSIDNSTGVAEIGAGSFTVNAGISAPNIMYGRVITNITGATTALNNPRTDYVYNATSGTFTLTMPTAASNTNRYTVKNSGTGIVTIGCTASQTIDGDSTYPLSTQYQAVDLISNGTNWIVV